jgi:hypothetical protein
MGKEYIQPGKLYILAVVRLPLRFWKFFFQIAFPFAGRLRNISVFAKIFHDVLIIDSIADQRQNRTNRNGKNNEYGNEKLQTIIFVSQIYHWNLFYRQLWWKSFPGCHNYRYLNAKNQTTNIRFK